jgi:hypothetical protein
MPAPARAYLVSLAIFVAACHAGLDVPQGTPDGGAPCTSIMSQTACSARTDCVADTCVECTCTPFFVGCRSHSQPQTMCPGLACAQEECCHNDSDCMPIGVTKCMVPPIILGCPICYNEPAPSNCQQDSDCTTPGQICDPVPCACTTPTPMACTPGCTSDANCPEPQSCGTDFRCHAKPCDSSCSGNYACDNTSATCTRKACASDSDCADLGYCIDQLCSHSFGQCVSIPV